MTSVYTDLTKEAGALGGPAALRAFYHMKGRVEGILIAAVVTGVSIGGTLIYSKMRARRTSFSTELAPEPERESATDASGNGPSSGSAS